jgi:hypothetical protein
MPLFRVSIRLDAAELKLLAAEINDRVQFLGLAEAERRVGCPIDNAFIDRGFTLVGGGTFVRAVPTAEIERAIQALWLPADLVPLRG